MREPLLCVTLGDMNGVGPEVVLRALTTLGGAPRALVVADGTLLRQAAQAFAPGAALHALEPGRDLALRPEHLNYIDTGTGAGAHLTRGQASQAAGVEAVRAQDIAFSLARSGQVGASIMGPVNADSIGMSGLRKTAIDPELGPFYLFLASGSLRIAHLTDHMPLVEVCTNEVKQDRVMRLLKTLHASMVAWGQAAPRIAVAGLNPHCRGREDRDEIAPAVRQAREDGIDATGPVSPDAVFRDCIDGRYDAVAAMYHDQGHIALKSWGFSAGTTVFMGLPILHLTVAHGSAYDIAWQGTADPTPMVAAIQLAGSLASGRGFL